MLKRFYVIFDILTDNTITHLDKKKNKSEVTNIDLESTNQCFENLRT